MVRILLTTFMMLLGSGATLCAESIEHWSTVAQSVGSMVVDHDDHDYDSALAAGSYVFIGQEGLAITLQEALPEGASSSGGLPVVLPDGSLSRAEILRHGSRTTSVLLRIKYAQHPPLLYRADEGAAFIGQRVFTAGNSFGAIRLDGQAAWSRGVISGRYDIASGQEPVRGRAGRVLSTYQGPVWETDAAVNDGNQGGPLVTTNGSLVGLISLGPDRARRLGTAIPIELICEDLGIDMPMRSSAKGPEADWVDRAMDHAEHSALLYLRRTAGLGNPQALPRPPIIDENVPVYMRENYRRRWANYFHQQQTFFTDQPVTAIAVDDRHLLTSASHLHGESQHGYLLDRNHIGVEVIAVDENADLALLRSDESHGIDPITWSRRPPTLGAPLILIGRHTLDADPTATVGIVSVADRRFEEPSGSFIQTDALANYGNLGGIAVDHHGNAVGIPVHMAPTIRWQINSGVALVCPAERIADFLNANDIESDLTNGHRIEDAYADRIAAAASRYRAATAMICSGSGVFISEDGLLLTNHHVIANESDFTVRTPDGQTWSSALLGSDPIGDIALLKTSRPSGPYLPLARKAAQIPGSASHFRPGVEVLAIGDAFSLGSTDARPAVTFGIIGTNRMVREEYTDCIQHDAPVNPGNSGGAALSLDGELLGINGQIRTVSGLRLNSGIGLAIAAPQLAEFVEILRKRSKGYAHHMMLPEELVLTENDHGEVLVDQAVVPLLTGDRLLSVAGRRVTSVETAIGIGTSLAWNGAPGTIEVVVEREGKQLPLKITTERQRIPGRPYHGLSIILHDGVIKVGSVDSSSPADEARIAVGDVILEANERRIENKIDFLRAVVPLEIGDILYLTLRHGDEERDVVLSLRER